MSGRIETGDWKGDGYGVVKLSEKWRAAYLNNVSERRTVIDYLERHVTSDELFVLVEGEANLVISGDGATGFEKIPLEKYVMVNVPPETFHSVDSAPGSRILIAENADVGNDNSQYHYLTAEEKAELMKVLNA